MICLTNCIITDYHAYNKNSIISKPENLKMIKIYDIKKIEENKLNVIKRRKERREIKEKSMKRIYIYKYNESEEKENSFSLFKKNLPMIISFSAISIGFIFTCIFTVVAYLFNQ